MTLLACHRIVGKPSFLVRAQGGGARLCSTEEWARQENSAKIWKDRNRQIASGERRVKQFTHDEQRSMVESHDEGEVWRWSDFYRGRLDRVDTA